MQQKWYTFIAGRGGDSIDGEEITTKSRRNRLNSKKIEWLDSMSQFVFSFFVFECEWWVFSHLSFLRSPFLLSFAFSFYLHYHLTWSKHAQKRVGKFFHFTRSSPSCECFFFTDTLCESNVTSNISVTTEATCFAHFLLLNLFNLHLGTWNQSTSRRWNNNSKRCNPWNKFSCSST